MDYERDKKELQNRLIQVKPESWLALNIAQALDQYPGDFEEKFSSAHKKIFEVLYEDIKAQGMRKLHLLGNIIHESQSIFLNIYASVVNQSLNECRQYDYANIFHQDLLESKTLGSRLFIDVMEAMVAQSHNNQSQSNLLSKTSNQLQDTIKGHFQDKGIELFEAQVNFIKDITDALLKAQFELYTNKRLTRRLQHVHKQLAQAKKTLLNLKPLPKASTVTFNPRVMVHAQMDQKPFSAEAFIKRQMIEHGRSFIFGKGMDQRVSPLRKLKRLETW